MPQESVDPELRQRLAGQFGSNWHQSGSVGRTELAAGLLWSIQGGLTGMPDTLAGMTLGWLCWAPFLPPVASASPHGLLTGCT